MRHPMQFIAALVFILLGTLTAMPAQADRLMLDNNAKVIPLGTNGFYLEDTEKSLNIDSITKSFGSQRWTKGQEDILSFGYTESAYWFYSPLTNTSKKPIERFIEIAYPVLDNIDAYFIRKHGLMEKFHLDLAKPSCIYFWHF